MLPRLGAKYPVEIEVVSMPKAEYHTDEYFEKNLPVAPAVMVGDEILVEAAPASEHEVEACIRKHLGLPALEPPKKGMLGRILGRSL